MDLYQQLQPHKDHTYKFIQLTPELIGCMDRNVELTLKSGPDNATLNLVSDDKTWKLRQMNHTNSSLLMHKQTPDQLVGKINLLYEYELTSTDVSIDIQDLPIYYNKSSVEMLDEDKLNYSLDELINNTPISIKQFMELWYDLGGCEINQTCFVLSSAIIKSFLDSFLTIVIRDKYDYKLEEYNIDISVFKDKVLSTNPELTEEIISSLFHKFCTENPTDRKLFRIDNEKVSKWFGIQVLKSHLFIDVKAFYLEWKNQFPPFYSIPINLSLLLGYYYKVNETIAYLDETELSNDLNNRLKQLFKLSSAWDLQDLVPFINKFIINKKAESVLLKYAKVKRSGSRKIVLPK